MATYRSTMRKNIFRDDKLDALAIAVNHWVESISRDENQSVKAHKEELLDAALEKFMNNQVDRGAAREVTIGNN